MTSSIREILLSILAVLLILVFGFKQLGTIFVECKNNFVSKKTIVATVEDLRKKEETIRLANERITKEQNILKPFYKQEFVTNDSVASFGGMFEDIIDYIKMNELMLRSIEYNINPDQDLIFKNFASSYNVCEIKLFMIGTYPQLLQFFRDIESYPYYINISKVHVKPYEYKNQYLLINMSINLYSKK